MILLVGRVLLAAVFAVAAVGKLISRGRTSSTLAEFGVPERFLRPLVMALPLAELAIAVALLPSATAPWAALAAAVMLVAFTVAVARVLARGQAVDCNCFGSLGASQITRWTAARNVFLLLLAAGVAVAGWNDAGTSAVGWLADLDSTGAIGLAAGVAILFAVVNFVFSWQLMRQNGRLLTELDALRRGSSGSARDGPQPGDPAPTFDLPALGGGRVTLEQLLAAGRGLTVVFTDPACGACDPLLPEVGRLQRDPATPVPLVVISQGDSDDNRAKAAEHGLEPVLIQEEFAVAHSCGAHGLPAALQLDFEGRIVSAPALGAERVGELLASLDPANLALSIHKVRA